MSQMYHHKTALGVHFKWKSLKDFVRHNYTLHFSQSVWLLPLHPSILHRCGIAKSLGCDQWLKPSYQHSWFGNTAGFVFLFGPDQYFSRLWKLGRPRGSFRFPSALHSVSATCSEKDKKSMIFFFLLPWAASRSLYAIYVLTRLIETRWRMTLVSHLFVWKTID